MYISICIYISIYMHIYNWPASLSESSSETVVSVWDNGVAGAVDDCDGGRDVWLPLPLLGDLMLLTVALDFINGNNHFRDSKSGWTGKSSVPLPDGRFSFRYRPTLVLTVFNLQFQQLRMLNKMISREFMIKNVCYFFNSRQEINIILSACD